MTVQQNHRFISNHFPLQTFILHIGRVKKASFGTEVFYESHTTISDQLCHDETRVSLSSFKKFSQCWDEEEEDFFPTFLYNKQLLRVMGSCWVSKLLKKSI